MWKGRVSGELQREAESRAEGLQPGGGGGNRGKAFGAESEGLGKRILDFILEQLFFLIQRERVLSLPASPPHSHPHAQIFVSEIYLLPAAGEWRAGRQRGSREAGQRPPQRPSHWGWSRPQGTGRGNGSRELTWDWLDLD